MMTFKGRTCLYHADHPRGRIFTDRGEYEQALRSGWVDAPGEIGNPEYVPADLRVLLSEVPAQEVKKAAESPPETEGSKGVNPQPIGVSPSSPPLKPWQKAQAAKKAKRQLGR